MRTKPSSSSIALALQRAIEAISSSPRSIDASPPRRRGRPPKAASATLFGAADGSTPAAAEPAAAAVALA
jgi:hypothetical protein